MKKLLSLVLVLTMMLSIMGGDVVKTLNLPKMVKQRQKTVQGQKLLSLMKNQLSIRYSLVFQVKIWQKTIVL